MESNNNPKKPLFTLCLASWKRPESVNNIVEAFRSQMYGDQIKFYIWNNNPNIDIKEFIKNKVNVTFFHSSRNIGPRAKLILYYKVKTPFIITWDDDIIPQNNALEYLYTNILKMEKKKPTITTFHGRRFKKNWTNYLDTEKLKEHKIEAVDHFGTGCSLFRKELITNQLLEDHGSDIIDDTWASYVFKNSNPNIKYYRVAYPYKFTKWQKNEQGIYTTRFEEVVKLKTNFLLSTRHKWIKIKDPLRFKIKARIMQRWSQQ